VHRSCSIALALLLTSGAARAQTTWTVDDDGPADFGSLPAAVAAAADGDTLLVRPGSYGQIVLDGKGLTIVGQGDVSVTGGGFFTPAVPSLDVVNLGVNQRLVLRNLDFFGATITNDGLRMTRLEDCAGPVLLEDCTVTPQFLTGYPMEASNCASLTLVRCSVIGGQSFIDTSTGSVLGNVSFTAVSVRDCQVAIYDSLLQGSTGRAGFDFNGQAVPPTDPGHGLRVIDSSFLVVGSELRGGDAGSTAGISDCTVGGDGAAGLIVGSNGGSPPGGTVQGSTLIGGLGAPGTCGLLDGSDGLDLDDPFGATTFWPGAARKSSITSPVVEGGVATLDFEGVPGDPVVALYGAQLLPAFSYLPEPTLLHVAPPFELLFLGTVPASGSGSIDFTMPQLDPGQFSATLFIQVAQIGAPLATYEGGPTALTILDASL
jgi:hypothetical protein